MKATQVFLNWISGFLILLAVDIFMEAIVFEWLEWNGTTKNDWFFISWWCFVLAWLIYGFIYGTTNLFRKPAA